MSSRQEAIERLLRPLRDTLETRAEDELTWSRADVTLRMILWWLNVGDDGRRKNKKSRFKKLIRFRKRNVVNVETAGLSEIESEWRNADGHFQLLRNKDCQKDSWVEWLSGSSEESNAFKVVSNGKVRMFRSQDARVAKKWKQAIDLRIMSWEKLLEIGTERFRELLFAHSEPTLPETTEDRKTAGSEKLETRKIAGMQCSGFVLKELDTALKVGVKVQENSKSSPNMLQSATDATNFLTAAPYIGYAFRIIGLGLELAMRLAQENEALQKAQDLLKKIIKNVVRASIYAKESGDDVGFYDFLNVIEKCDIAGQQLEFYGFCSTTMRVKKIALGKKIQSKEIISHLEDLYDDLTQDLTLNIYHHIVSSFAKASLLRKKSSRLSRNSSGLTPWPEEIAVPDGGSYVGNERLLAQISEILTQGKRKKGSLKNAMVVHKCIVSSPRGMGKTELVKQYARSNRDLYKGGVYWVEAEKESTLVKSFQVIREQIRAFIGFDSGTRLGSGREIQCVESEDHKQLKAECETLFGRLGRKKGAWLLIFDNADKINGDRDFRVGWMPSEGLGSVLVTTRLHAGDMKLRNFAEACNPTHITDSLQKLGVDDARSLLLFHAGRREGKLSEEETGYVARIVGPVNLDGHPLAVVQAGFYLRETLMSFKEYAQLLGHPDLPGVITLDECEKEEGKRSIMKTFLPSKSKLSEAAKELLSILCWLPPDGIAERDLRKCSDPSINAFNNSSLQKCVGERGKGSDGLNGLLKEGRWINVVREVCKYGLIQRIRKGEVLISAHRLVYAMERDSLKKPQQESRLRSAIVTAIMLLQHHLQTRKDKSNTIPFSDYRRKHSYSRFWNTANLHRALGYFLARYDTHSHSEVFRFYQYAASLEDRTAIFNLGTFYEKGVGVEKDEKRAAELYAKAADLKHADATYNLGVLYERGIGVGKDEKRAAELYGKAAELEHAVAMYNLGVLYEIGKGVEKDEKRAAKLYGEAAELQDAGAMYNLGVLHRDGIGVEQDEKRAAQLFDKAAQLGHAWGMCGLGGLYKGGRGVKKDMKYAAELFSRAVELGNTWAMNELGQLYKKGKGVEKDKKRAAALFSKARSLGGVN